MVVHWIWLSQRKGIGHVGCKKLLERVPDAEQLYYMTPEQYASLGMKEMRKNWIESLSDKDLRDAEKVISDCERYGIKWLCYNDPCYPKRLKEIYDPPCILYYKGTMPNIDEEASVGVVGTRRCSNYGLLTAKQLSTLISLSGGIVVSGGARGIDTISLSCALSSVMPVICVLAGGLDEYYPKENTDLFEAITNHGCLISEMPPGVRPTPKYFVGRNRLISGLSLGVLVVEAPQGSGALTTAELALSQNRDVFTVRRADSGKWCQGNEELINTGCEVITDGWDLMSRYAHMFPGRVIDGRSREAMQRLCIQRYGTPFAVYSPIVELNREVKRRRPVIHENAQPSEVGCGSAAPKTDDRYAHTSDRAYKDIPTNYSEPEKRILSVVGSTPMEMDDIIAKSGMDPTAVTTALTMLQIKRRIIKCFGNSYQRL